MNVRSPINLLPRLKDNVVNGWIKREHGGIAITYVSLQDIDLRNILKDLKDSNILVPRVHVFCISTPSDHVVARTSK